MAMLLQIKNQLIIIRLNIAVYHHKEVNSKKDRTIPMMELLYNNMFKQIRFLVNTSLPFN